MDSASWQDAEGAPVLARLMAAHVESEGRQETERARWRKFEAPAMESQTRTMEEMIAMIEREMRNASAALAKAEAEERRGGLSSGGTPAELELLLGVLEDKHLLTSQELEKTRRLSYFPVAEGYQLRFSYGDTFLGFKELLLEELSGSVTLSVSPGVGAEGQEARVPTVVLQLGGPGSSGLGGGRQASASGQSSTGEQGSSELPGGTGAGGALLRFLGEGVSLVSRREMLGVALSPNISLAKMDVSVRFAATIPLVYFPRRRAWRLATGFKIELMQDREASGGAPEHLLRALIQSLVEGVMKTIVHRQVSTTCCERAAPHARRAAAPHAIVLIVHHRPCPAHSWGRTSATISAWLPRACSWSWTCRCAVCRCERTTCL